MLMYLALFSALLAVAQLLGGEPPQVLVQKSWVGFMLVSIALAAHLCSHQCLEGTAPSPWWTFGVLFTALWVVTGWG